MDRSILRRIEELERHRPNSIMCLARNMETGEEKEMQMRELAERCPEWNLVRVTSGNDLTDLDAYLKSIFEYAKEQCNEKH